MKARPASGGPTCILQDRSGWGNRVGACDNQRCAIAIRNLDAQIAGYAWQAVEQRSSVADRAALVGLITLRGHLRGRIVDYERAADHEVVARRGRRTSIRLVPSGCG